MKGRKEILTLPEIAAALAAVATVIGALVLLLD